MIAYRINECYFINVLLHFNCPKIPRFCFFKTIFMKVHLFQQMRLSVYIFTKYYLKQLLNFHHKHISLQMFVRSGLIDGNSLESFVKITKNGIV